MVQLERRDKFVLAAMAASERNVSFGPAQLQKMFFLLDREVPGMMGGALFNFTPYDYGPFDKAVYRALETLADQKLVSIDLVGHRKSFSTTDAGYSLGRRHYSQQSVDFMNYARTVNEWVRATTFGQMVSSIYAKYPDTKVNSIFS